MLGLQGTAGSATKHHHPLFIHQRDHCLILSLTHICTKVCSHKDLHALGERLGFFWQVHEAKVRNAITIEDVRAD